MQAVISIQYTQRRDPQAEAPPGAITSIESGRSPGEGPAAVSGGDQVSTAQPSADWLEREAVPAIRDGIATVARRRLALDILHQWPDALQEAFQNATLKVWLSATARRMVAEERWEELRKFSHRAGHNAAIDLIRDPHIRREVAAGDPDVGEPISAMAPENGPDLPAVQEDHRQTLRALLTELRALVSELPQSAEHPTRKILGLYLQLLDQELKAAASGESSGPPGTFGLAATSWNPATGMQRPTHEDPLWTEWVRLLVGDDQALPTYREERLDLQVAAILRPPRIEGEEVSQEEQRQAGQWVRSELSRARKRLRVLYEERYHKTPAW
jgi:DNA-directed RNA polymerase specialized sigma24 family protein